MLLFFHRHPSGWGMFLDMSLSVSSNCATAPWLPEEAVGDFVTPFVLEKLFDYSCSVELAGSYSGHVPCKFWKVCLGLKYLPQINYGGKLTCFGCSPRIGYHWFVACWMGLQFLRVRIPAAVTSDMDAPMRGLCCRTLPDGAVGIFSWQLWWSCCWLPLCGILYCIYADMLGGTEKFHIYIWRNTGMVPNIKL